MGWRSNKKGLAIVGLFLFLMGVVVPAVFGLLTEKAMDLGVGDLLEKDTQWQGDFTNSTYFYGQNVQYYDNATGSKYGFDPIYDDSSDMYMVLYDTTGTLVSSASVTSDWGFADTALNSSALSNVDKIVVLAKIEDPGKVNLEDAHVIIEIRDNDASSYKYVYTYNATEAYNNTIRLEFTIDAVKRLKIENDPDNLIVSIKVSANEGKTIDLDGLVLAWRIELYDVKKVNATAASNIMLAVSGVLGWLGALAATPYWNPYANREHRDVRRVYKKLRRRR